MNQKETLQKFPIIVAETLSGKKITFPEVTKGKFAFILIAFKRQTQGEVDSWLDPFIKEFGKHKSVTFYEIPMISTGWKWMSGWIDAGMRAGVPKSKHDHVATYYGPLSKYFNHFNVKDPGTVYVFLLDKQGNIIYKNSGPADDYKLSELRRFVNERIGS